MESNKHLIKDLTGKIHKINCIDFLTKLPDNCIDVITTSPPYNMGNVNRSENPKRVDRSNIKEGSSRDMTLFNEGYSDFDDCLPYSVYVAQQRHLLKEMIRVLTPGGAIFYNTKWRLYSGELDPLTSITDGFDKNLRQIIIWNKFSTMAYSETFLMPKYEVIYLFTKGDESTLRFNKDYINYGDVWEFAGEKDNKHPAPFPLELPHRAIGSVYNNSQKLTVYDPYMGSGTTAVAAECHGYDWIGTDVSESYIEMAMKRIEKNRICSEVNFKTEQGKLFKQFDNKDSVTKVNKISF